MTSTRKLYYTDADKATGRWPGEAHELHPDLSAQANRGHLLRLQRRFPARIPRRIGYLPLTILRIIGACSSFVEDMV